MELPEKITFNPTMILCLYAKQDNYTEFLNTHITKLLLACPALISSSKQMKN